MSRRFLRALAFQSFSVLIAGYVLISMFAIQTGRAGGYHILYTVCLVGVGVLLRYVWLYHRFSRRLFRRLAIAIATALLLTVLTAGALFVEPLALDVTPDGAVPLDPATLSTALNIPWWIPGMLLLAGLLLLGGAVSRSPGPPYPRPSSLRNVALSPPVLGVGYAIFGLWAVLFVGVAIQRVVVVAPLFEELLKFGVALLVGSVLFGRSRAGRIGTALVVGLVFGLVEHATTYPDETPILYLYRSVFHSLTTVLSVSVYTTFERREADALRWLSPVFSILIHFFNNAFSVISGILSVSVVGSVSPTLPLVYGGLVILVATVLFGLTIASARWTAAIHRPFQQVLSDLV